MANGTSSSSPHQAVIDSLFRCYDELSLAAFRTIRAEAKADGTTITRVDREVSRIVIEALKQHTPQYGIISEEEPAPYRPEADWQWVIDPLDGTAAFARGYPVWGLGIGLMRRWEPLEGYVHFPVLSESYGFDGRTLCLNGQPAPPIEKDSLPDTRNYLIDSSLHKRISTFATFKDAKLRVFGSNLFHMVSLAMGRAEAMICGRVYLWDLAAALPMTRARGFTERYVDGSPFRLDEINREANFRIRAPLILSTPARIEVLVGALRPVL